MILEIIIGILGFSVVVLGFTTFNLLNKNEKAEDIEILRFLELDIPVKMVKVSGSSMAVDIKSDIKKVEKKLKK